MALYPQDPQFKSVKPSLMFKNNVSESYNGYQQAAECDGMGIEFACGYNKLSYQEALKIRGFLIGLRGKAKTCDLVLPIESHTYADPVGSTIQASALTSAGAKSVSFKNGLPNKTLRYAGEFIQIAGHDKAYVLTSDLVTDATGNGAATFEPALYSQVLENEQIIIDEVVFKVIADSDVVKWSLEPGRLYSFSVKFKEAIR